MSKADVIPDALRMAVACYGAAFLPRLRAMTYEERRVLLEEVGVKNAENPLYLPVSAFNAAELKELVIPIWDTEPLTPARIIALGVFGLFVQMGEDLEQCYLLAKTWPIRDGLEMERVTR
jgi:hypothetical protein